VPHVALACEPGRESVPDRLRTGWLRIGLISNPSVERDNLFRLHPDLDLNAGLLPAGSTRAHVVP
jgi:hypothetical protein